MMPPGTSFPFVICGLLLSSLSWAQRPDPIGDLLRKLDQPRTIGDMIEKYVPEGPNEDIRQWNEEVFLDPDFGRVTVTNEPGKNWKDCKQQKELGLPSSCIGWPDSTSKLRLNKAMEPLLVSRENPATGVIEKITYVNVQYEYTRDGRKQKGDGWVDAGLLRQKELKPLFKREAAPTKPPAVSAPETKTPAPAPNVRPPPKNCPPSPAGKNQRAADEAGKAFEKKWPLPSTASQEKTLHEFVGHCPLKNPTQKPPLSRWKDKNIYDVEVLPELKKKQKHLPVIAKQAAPGAPIEMASFDDLVNIDVLARTLYSEMNECFQVGLQYPMAVAKIALNRAQESPRFVKGPHQEKPILAKVLTSTAQFSVWNYTENERNKTSLMSLCPTRQSDNEKNWKGEKPNPSDVQAWDFAVKIASEAVLFPGAFEAKTSDVTQVNYTSKRTEFFGMKRGRPMIEGRAVESLRCMYVWNEK